MRRGQHPGRSDQGTVAAGAQATAEIAAEIDHRAPREAGGGDLLHPAVARPDRRGITVLGKVGEGRPGLQPVAKHQT